MSPSQRVSLVLRADAGADIGSGHVMRCLALAQAWQAAGGRATWVSTTPTPCVQARWQAEGIDCAHLGVDPGSDEDARATADAAARLEASWVVVDGYHFRAAYHDILKGQGLAVLVVDDVRHAERYGVDLVLNQNLHAQETWYANRDPDTRLLLGPQYALVRQEFVRGGLGRRKIPRIARHVLITLGGSDGNNVTGTVIRAIQQLEIEGVDAVAVMGAHNPHEETLSALVKASRVPIRLERHVANMAELMDWADVAISAAGTTCWELACAGVPSCLVVTVDHQRAVAESLTQRGIMRSLGWWEQLTPSALSDALGALMVDVGARTHMAEQGRQLVDGRGSRRVVAAMGTQGTRPGTNGQTSTAPQQKIQVGQGGSRPADMGSMKRTVAITGAGGFIGSRVVSGLAERGWTVYALTSRPEQVRAHPQVHPVRCLWTEEGVAAACEHVRASVWIHAAARVELDDRDLQALYRDNALLTERLARCIAHDTQVERFIYLSSVSVYGSAQERRADVDPVPDTHYGLSKLLGERLCSSHLGARCAIVRLPGVWGKESHAKLFINRCLSQAEQGLSLPAVSDGRARRNYLWVGDIPSLLERAALEGWQGVSIAAGPQAVSMQEMVSAIAAQFGVSVQPGAQGLAASDGDVLVDASSGVATTPFDRALALEVGGRT